MQGRTGVRSRPYAQFAVGDHVETIGSLVPEWMRSGVIIRVIPNDQGLDLFNEYEVIFGNNLIAIFYEADAETLKNEQRYYGTSMVVV